MKDIKALFEQAAQATEAGHHQVAINAYQLILKQSEPASQAQHLACWGIGEIHLNNKQYDKAESFLKQALELKPDEAIYHYLLGCTYRYVNKVKDAVFHLQRAVDLDPAGEQYWGELGWVIGFNQDVAKGIRLLKKALAINPANPGCLKDICMLYAKQGKWAEAQLCIEEAVKLDPDNAHIQQIEKEVAFFRSEFVRLQGQEGR